ncbi:MAG: nucleotidyltransferase [Acidilobaceae archaeon]
MVSRRAFAEAVKALYEEGFEFVVIGGTIVELLLNSNDLGDDVDVFSQNPLIYDEEVFASVASSRRWVLGQTWLGTPRLVVRTSIEEVLFEFYDNIHDFYVPPSFLEKRTSSIRIGDVEVRTLGLEEYLTLKANAGRSSDMNRLKEISRIVRAGKLSIDKTRLYEDALEFEDSHVILRRLREAELIASQF